MTVSVFSSLSGVLNEAYEKELRQNPRQIRIWLSYIDSLTTKENRSARWLLYERALKHVPRSYKVWKRYLTERLETVAQLHYVAREVYDEMNSIYQRCLGHMAKMPRIWVDFLQFLMQQRFRSTLVRKTLDSGLRSLPIAQHYRLWNEVVPWVREEWVPTATGLNLFRRYLMLQPGHVETYVAYLLEKKLFREGA